MNYPAHEGLPISPQGKALKARLLKEKARYEKMETTKGRYEPFMLYYVIERLDKRDTQMRWIRFYLKDESKLGYTDITLAMAELTGYRYKHGTIRAGGCGMDMIFSVYSNLPSEIGYDFIRHDDLWGEIHFYIERQKQKETA